MGEAQVARSRISANWPRGANTDFDTSNVDELVERVKDRADDADLDAKANTVFMVHTPLCASQPAKLVWDPSINSVDVEVSGATSLQSLSALSTLLLCFVLLAQSFL